MYDWVKDLSNRELTVAFETHVGGLFNDELSPLGEAVLDELDRRAGDAGYDSIFDWGEVS